MIKTELIDHMGDDVTVVNAARVSFNKRSLPDVTGDVMERDAKLIRYLAKHNHFTPFTHPQITLRETVPVFVARQRFKHVVGFSYNEISRRYVDESPQFYYPTEWRGRPDGSVKQGSGGVVVFNNQVQDHYAKVVEYAQRCYEQMLENHVAPEMARMVLPQSMMTSYYVTGSLAAFARLYKQRIDGHAQKEIQILADQIGKIIAPLFPVSWQALTAGN